MTGTAENFLRYNEENVMMHLLAVEDHLRNLSPEYETEHASCIYKHALQLKEQSLEGISHSSELHEEEKAQIFERLKLGASEIQEGLKSRIPPTELIRRVRELRGIAEGLDPSYSLQKCEACEVGLPVVGNPYPRPQKSLIYNSPTHSNRGTEMVSENVKRGAGIYGGAWVGKATVKYVLPWVDTLAPTLPVYLKPSLWAGILSLGLPLVLDKIPEQWQNAALAAGGFISTSLLETAPPVFGVTLAAPYAVSYAAPAIMSVPPVEVTAPGRYVVTG